MDSKPFVIGQIVVNCFPSSAWHRHAGIVTAIRSNGATIEVQNIYSERGIWYGGPFLFWCGDVVPNSGEWSKIGYSATPAQIEAIQKRDVQPYVK